jgi:hypothetical protein
MKQSSCSLDLLPSSGEGWIINKWLEDGVPGVIWDGDQAHRHLIIMQMPGADFEPERQGSWLLLGGWGGLSRPSWKASQRCFHLSWAKEEEKRRSRTCRNSMCGVSGEVEPKGAR